MAKRNAQRPTDRPQTSRPGTRLDARIRSRYGLSWNAARQRIERGKVFLNGQRIVDPGYIVGTDDAPEIVEDARVIRVEDEHLPKKAFLAIDNDIVVVNKPAGILTVPFRPEDRNTLDFLIGVVLTRREGHGARSQGQSRCSVSVVHRLDRGTSGVIVFARNRSAHVHLKAQFREHTAQRRYIALVHGHVESTTVRTHLVRDRGDGLRGSVEHVSERKRRRLSGGRVAITHIETLERLRDATLVACTLETGRTNQIRIHMSELGHPLVGETVYSRGHGLTRDQAKRLCLHAEQLGFVHPRHGAPLHFSAPIPTAMLEEIASRRN